MVDDQRAPNHAHPMSELSRLVQEVNHSGVSYARMAERAARHGYPVTASYLHQVQKGKVKRPGIGMLAAIAKALDLPEWQVREAAGRAAGTHVEHNVPYQTSQLLGFVEDMSPGNRDRWFRLSQAIARELAEEEKVGGPRTVITTDTGERPDSHTERRTRQSLEEAEARALQGRERRRRQG